MVERTLSYSYVYLFVDKTMCKQKRRLKGGDFLCARFPSCVFLCARIPSCGIEKWYDIAFRTYVPARTRSVDRNMNINCGRPNMRSCPNKRPLRTKTRTTFSFVGFRR